jgi:hypothetical protein
MKTCFIFVLLAAALIFSSSCDRCWREYEPCMKEGDDMRRVNELILERSRQFHMQNLRAALAECAKKFPDNKEARENCMADVTEQYDIAILRAEEIYEEAEKKVVKHMDSCLAGLKACRGR